MYYEKELLQERVSRLERKNSSRREITFHLNDYTSSQEKTYYFCFEHLTDGFVKITAEGKDENLTLKIGNTLVTRGENFYLEKGVWEVSVSLSGQQDTVVISVLGEVIYHDASLTKVLTCDNFSVIGQYCNGLFCLYKYDNKVTLLEQFETSSADMILNGTDLTVYRIVGEKLEKIEYLQDFSASVVSQYNLEGITQIKCSKSGLYIVVSGKLYSVTIGEDLQKTDTGLLVKELLAIDETHAVYRDYDDKIKLCSYSVSP